MTLTVHTMRERAFTLIEMLLSVTLLAIIFGTSYAMFTNVAHQGELDSATRSMEALLRKAMILSSAVESDSSWGVFVDAEHITLFKGGSYEGRDLSYDEVVALPNLQISGRVEYVFQRVSGLPSDSGRIDFTNGYTGQSRELSINEKGAITIE